MLFYVHTKRTQGGRATKSEEIIARLDRRTVVDAMARVQRVAVAYRLTGFGHRVVIGQNDFPALDDDVARADIAMYQTKAAGKNDYCIYTSDLLTQANRRLALEGDLRRGIEQDEFFLMYQPQVEILSGRIVGLEALVRWRHPDRGVLPPGHFIAVAEQTGLIVPLGRRIISLACQDWAAWRDAGANPPRLAVNVSIINS